MKIGPKSVLFGVHQFVWHPVTVALAWKRVHRRWPNWKELIAIAMHDLGYIGCSDMDGESGSVHPSRSCLLWWTAAYRIAKLIPSKHQAAFDAIASDISDLIEGHSGKHCKDLGLIPSDLYLPDKVSVLYDPDWFYLLRSWLTGEIHEYVGNSPVSKRDGETYFIATRRWLTYYKVLTIRRLFRYRSYND